MHVGTRPQLFVSASLPTAWASCHTEGVQWQQTFNIVAVASCCDTLTHPILSLPFPSLTNPPLHFFLLHHHYHR